VPLYEYKCKQCGHSFEKIQKFSEKPLTECPECKGELVRPMTAPALQFKGAGWYINDYSAKGSSQKSAAAAESAGKVENVSASGDTATPALSTSGGDSAASAPAAPATAPAASAPATTTPTTSK